MEIGEPRGLGAPRIDDDQLRAAALRFADPLGRVVKRQKWRARVGDHRIEPDHEADVGVGERMTSGREHSHATERIAVTPAAGDDGARLDVFPPDVARELAAAAKAEPPDGRFRYRLTSRRFMHPEDMAAVGIRDGGAVEIRSAHGSVRARVAADLGMRRGVVALSHGWGALDEPANPMGRVHGPTDLARLPP